MTTMSFHMIRDVYKSYQMHIRGTKRDQLPYGMGEKITNPIFFVSMNKRRKKEEEIEPGEKRRWEDGRRD